MDDRNVYRQYGLSIPNLPRRLWDQVALLKKQHNLTTWDVLVIALWHYFDVSPPTPDQTARAIKFVKEMR